MYHYSLQKAFFLFALVAAASAAPAGDEPIAIISQESNIEPDGGYKYR